MNEINDKKHLVGSLEKQLETIKKNYCFLIEFESLLKQHRAKQILNLPEDIELRFNSSCISLLKKQPNSNYLTEILSINKGFEKRSCYLSTYSTSIDSDFELERLIFNGEIAKRILTKNLILEDLFVEVVGFNYTLLELLANSMFEVERQISTLKTEIYNFEKQTKVTEILNGKLAVWDEPVEFYYGSGKFDFLPIKSIKVLMFGNVNSEVELTNLDTSRRIVSTKRSLKPFLELNFETAILK